MYMPKENRTYANKIYYSQPKIYSACLLVVTSTIDILFCHAQYSTQTIHVQFYHQNIGWGFVDNISREFSDI